MTSIEEIATRAEHRRSVHDVLYDIVGNIQDIFRSEVQLAKTEMQDQVAAAVTPAATLGVGLVLAIHALGLLLLALVYAVATVVPMWSAALLVSAATAIVAVLFIRLGSKRLKHVSVTPEKTIASLKETMQWVKKPIA